jgi:hypothetical protein
MLKHYCSELIPNKFDKVAHCKNSNTVEFQDSSESFIPEMSLKK